ncbi:MAG: hypothetical protein C4326_09250 [Ignavibacteria bacterium]
MRLTKIERQKNNPSRKNLYLNGAFALGVSTDTLIAFGLRTGDEIDEQQLKALQAAENLRTAKHTALRFLARRPRTEKEIRDKLREQEFSDAEIVATLQALRDARLVDDEAFARAFIQNHLRLHGKGPLALKQQLLLLGVRKETVEAALKEGFDEQTQQAVALEAARKYMRRSARLRGDPRGLRHKLAAFLTRRGFSWDVVFHVLTTALGTTDDGDAV